MEARWSICGSSFGMLVFVPSNNCNMLLTIIPQYADVAQQAFSSEQGSTLHLAIPALETLHRAWSSRVERPKYAWFASALKAAAAKLDEYYEKTTDSPAYIMAMCSLFILQIDPI